MFSIPMKVSGLSCSFVFSYITRTYTRELNKTKEKNSSLEYYHMTYIGKNKTYKLKKSIQRLLSKEKAKRVNR